MRLLKYLEYAPVTQETNLFRAMTIKLNDKPQDYSPVINSLHENHISNVDDILRRINVELLGVYHGRGRLALCLDEGLQVNKLKIKNSYMEKLKEILYSSNTELAKIKENIESSS